MFYNKCEMPDEAWASGKIEEEVRAESERGCNNLAGIEHEPNQPLFINIA